METITVPKIRGLKINGEAILVLSKVYHKKGVLKIITFVNLVQIVDIKIIGMPWVVIDYGKDVNTENEGLNEDVVTDVEKEVIVFESGEEGLKTKKGQNSFIVDFQVQEIGNGDTENKKKIQTFQTFIVGDVVNKDGTVKICNKADSRTGRDNTLGVDKRRKEGLKIL